VDTAETADLLVILFSSNIFIDNIEHESHMKQFGHTLRQFEHHFKHKYHITKSSSTLSQQLT